MKKIFMLMLFSLIALISLSACSTMVGQIKDKADEKKLLKAGALDAPIAIPNNYPNYQYKFLEKFHVSHDWYGWSGCKYASHYNGFFFAVTDIFEEGEHTWQISSIPGKPFNIDNFTRIEWANGNGDILKGFQSICFESWQTTQHFLTIYLNKRTLQVPNIYGLKDGVISHEKVGNNTWWVQKFDYQPYKINSSGRVVESWVLPIANTGYVFIFVFGANQDSLKNPQAHAQMQAIFRHLIESVKIEPIQQ